MSAKEKNPSVEGSLANGIEKARNRAKTFYGLSATISSVSFADAAKESDANGPYHVLDVFIAEKLSATNDRSASEGWKNLNGGAYFVKLEKWNNSTYCGYLQSYALRQPTFFAFRNNVYELHVFNPVSL